jgi:hypothetical protein
MHRSTLDALNTPLNRPLNTTRHQVDKVRARGGSHLLPQPPALACMWLFFAEHACIGFVCLRSPLHMGIAPPAHHQLVLLFLAGIRARSFAHISVLY